MTQQQMRNESYLTPSYSNPENMDFKTKFKYTFKKYPKKLQQHNFKCRTRKANKHYEEKSDNFLLISKQNNGGKQWRPDGNGKASLKNDRKKGY